MKLEFLYQGDWKMKHETDGRGKAELWRELDECVLLCQNCHAEVLAARPTRWLDAARPFGPARRVARLQHVAEGATASQ
jgi:hypothetical protein